ncbi:hypothetical protein [Thiobacillus sp. 0-1251]|uniref:hypothetical protein n=1 Tax=Thiobacillus sp. 0-1251 TaxID=1895858 RepID=UPI0009669C74|nr:hypothetical protein [Thiobacillus sp. 0-1251]OJY56377.1 MAG: hypothetical protein BGP19_05870 [Thiobacillus sp. 0-1251]
MGYKIVHVQEAPPRKIVADPETRDGNHTIRFLHKGHPIAGVFLASDSRKKLVLCNMRAKRPHYGKAISNLIVRCGYVNAHDR